MLRRAAVLKRICDRRRAQNADLALTALEDLEEKWGKKYPASIGS